MSCCSGVEYKHCTLSFPPPSYYYLIPGLSRQGAIGVSKLKPMIGRIRYMNKVLFYLLQNVIILNLMLSTNIA